MAVEVGAARAGEAEQASEMGAPGVAGQRRIHTVLWTSQHCFMCLQFGSLFADTATCRKHVKECSKQYGSSKPAVKVSTTSRSYGM